MDGLPNVPYSNRVNFASLRGILSVAGGILAGVAGFLLVILLLNYFGIIPLSRSNPRLFGFLPQKAVLKQPSASQKGAAYLCPVRKNPCPTPEIITKSAIIENFQGLGYQQLAEGTEVVSIFSGQYEVKQLPPSQNPDNINITVKDDEKDYLATYFISGKTDLEGRGDISKGETVAVLSGKGRGKQNFGQNYNLIIYVQSSDNLQIKKLSPSSDGISIE